MIPGSASPFFLGSSLATATAGGLQIERSLRFNSSDSAYCGRTFGTATSRKTWTWAGWVKKCNNSAQQSFFSAGNSGTNRSNLLFQGTGEIRFFNYPGSVDVDLITTPVFRDPSAWYHILIAVDTTQATSTNRFKLYVNGTQFSTFSTATYPSLNQDLVINSAIAHGIGRGEQVGEYFDGYLTNIHFIDGQALTPSSFTETDATTGQLIPKTYTGSYGTNGFNLLFADNSSNTASTLGKDTSGNSNNWTPNNFSVVAGGPATITTPASNAPPTVDYLVIGGGGGGGNTYGGGGGAGGYRTANGSSVTSATQYTVTIGGGGAGAAGGVAGQGSNGSASTFGSITAAGGGGGGGYLVASQAGLAGGSGGGGGGESGSGGLGGAGNTPSTSPSQGNSGGSSPVGNHQGAGGGGATGVGSAGTGAAAGGIGGTGGAGTASSITGSSITRAGGGGGGAWQGTGGTGGTGGGGAGSGGVSVGSAGTTNTGGGGGGGGGVGNGGASTNGGGAGGSGIVIIRYADTYGDLTVGSGLTYTYANTGGYKIYSFTANTTAAQAAGNDSLVDSPTNYGTDTGVGGEVRGNYCTWNPLANGAGTLSNGNLDCTVSTRRSGTVSVNSGKWYWEVTLNGSGDCMIGIIPVANANYASQYAGVLASEYTYYSTNGRKYTGGTSAAYGATFTSGDIIGAALDLDIGTIVFYKNGVSQGTAFSSISGTYTSTTSAGGSSGPSVSANFGQRAFAYTAPSGFKALCTQNLPEGTITTSGTYTGNGVADGPFVYLNGVPTAMTVGVNAVTFGTDADKLSNGFKLRTTNVLYNQNALSYSYSITTTGSKFKYARAQPNP